jgi:hypothetical protein
MRKEGRRKEGGGKREKVNTRKQRKKKTKKALPDLVTEHKNKVVKRRRMNRSDTNTTNRCGCPASQSTHTQSCANKKEYEKKKESRRGKRVLFTMCIRPDNANEIRRQVFIQQGIDGMRGEI